MRCGADSRGRRAAEDAAEDILAYRHVPLEHQRQLHSTNPPERLPLRLALGLASGESVGSAFGTSGFRASTPAALGCGGQGDGGSVATAWRIASEPWHIDFCFVPPAWAQPGSERRTC
jgi:hypothetical protein